VGRKNKKAITTENRGMVKGLNTCSGMRILHIGKYYPPSAGGIEHFLFDLLHASKQRGLSVAAVVHNERAGAKGVEPAPEDPLAIYRVPSFGRVLYAPVSPAFPRWLDRAIRQFGPDLLHIHLPNSSALAALVVSRARRIPWVLHWHSDVVTSEIDRRLALAYHLYRPFEQRLLARSAAVIATSPPYLESSKALKPWRDRCTAIPLGLDSQRLPDPSPGQVDSAESFWRPNALRVLTIGRLTYYKGHKVLLRAVERIPNAQAMIVGTGVCATALIRLRRKLALEDRVLFLGKQPQQTLTALLASCHVLTLPSLERTEAFGLVLLEAMRFGKPVIASDIPGSGTGWVVRQAGHGLVTPPGDIDALAEALKTLEHDTELRWHLGQNGAMALEEQFGISPVAKAISDVYSQVLNNTTPPTGQIWAPRKIRGARAGQDAPPLLKRISVWEMERSGKRVFASRLEKGH
jgi:rhamnosyl/mannosyltransferase